MTTLVTVAEVKTRWGDIASFPYPDGASDAKITELITQASGRLMTKAGLTSAPTGDKLDALKDLCVQLVILYLHQATAGNNADLHEAIGRNISRVMAEAESYAEEQTGGMWLDLAGGSI